MPILYDRNPITLGQTKAAPVKNALIPSPLEWGQAH